MATGASIAPSNEVHLTRSGNLTMHRWLILLTVAAGCLGNPAAACAQDNPWSGEPGRFVPAMGNGAWPPYGGYPPMATPYGSTPSPWSFDPSQAPTGPIVNQGSYPRPRTVHEFLPEGDVRGPFYETSTGGSRLRDALQETYIRVDYLNFNLTDPGERLIGAEWLNTNARDVLHSLNNADPLSASVIPLARERDGTVRNDIAGAFLIVPDAADLSPFDLDHRNGVRLTVGVPTGEGAFEGNIWSLQKDDDSYRITPHTDEFGIFFVIPAIPLTNNGRLVDPTFDVSAPMVLFDDFMHVQFGTEMYGAELNYFRGAIRHNAPLRIELMAGARYVRLREDLFITGNDLRQQVSPEILAVSSNHVFGPSFGLRMEFEHWIFKFGADTRFTAAFNRHNNLVRTVDLFPNAPFPTQSDDDHTDFSPVHEVQVYAQMKLTHRLKLRVGYNLLTLFEMSRPQNNVVWDDSGVVDGPVRIRAGVGDLETFQAGGLFVSGEWSLF
jgi:hypothetical protein